MLYPKRFKDPQAVLDYQFNWGEGARGEPAWLQDGETVQTETITISPAGSLELDASDITNSGRSVTFWLTGGTAGTSYTVRCRIVTNASRTDVRSMTVVVQNR